MTTPAEELRQKVLKALYPHIDDGGSHTIDEARVGRVTALLLAQQQSLLEGIESPEYYEAKPHKALNDLIKLIERIKGELGEPMDKSK